MSETRLRVEMELTDSQKKRLEELMEDDYDEAVDMAETIMMEMPMITNVELVEIH